MSCWAGCVQTASCIPAPATAGGQARAEAQARGGVQVRGSGHPACPIHHYDDRHHGKAVATAWDRLHPLLVRRSAWADYPEGQLPVIEGTVIRLQVDHLRGDRSPRPVWLRWSLTGAMAGDVDRIWQAFLRRFDLEHTFRRMKQTLGWTAPKLREPAAADRWTWLVIAAHTQLRLARPLAQDLRKPWERPARKGRLTPARVRRGFRRLHGKTPQPADAPKPSTAEAQADQPA